MHRGDWWATRHGVTKSGTQLSDLQAMLFPSGWSEARRLRPWGPLRAVAVADRTHVTSTWRLPEVWALDQQGQRHHGLFMTQSLNR